MRYLGLIVDELRGAAFSNTDTCVSLSCYFNVSATNQKGGAARKPSTNLICTRILAESTKSLIFRSPHGALMKLCV